MTYTYYPKGVCSSKIEIDLNGDVITDVRVEDGCDGNLKGIVRLIQGGKAVEVAEKLRGVTCGDKATSCPDQLSKALDSMLEKCEKGGCNGE